MEGTQRSVNSRGDADQFDSRPEERMTHAVSQRGLNLLLPSMQFSLDSDIGLCGRPGPLIIGEGGWGTTAVLPWTLCKEDEKAMQLVPFFGVDDVETTITPFSFSNTLGPRGTFIRYIRRYNWILKLSYAHQLETDDNPDPWDDWGLNDVHCAKAIYSF